MYVPEPLKWPYCSEVSAPSVDFHSFFPTLKPPKWSGRVSCFCWIKTQNEIRRRRSVFWRSGYSIKLGLGQRNQTFTLVTHPRSVEWHHQCVSFPCSRTKRLSLCLQATRKDRETIKHTWLYSYPGAVVATNPMLRLMQSPTHTHTHTMHSYTVRLTGSKEFFYHCVSTVHRIYSVK